MLDVKLWKNCAAAPGVLIPIVGYLGRLSLKEVLFLALAV